MARAGPQSKDKNRLKKPLLFSKHGLIVFALIFAALGGYALYRSFAAGPSTNWGTGATPTTSVANIWVSPTGNDSTCSRSSTAVGPTSPCATFQKAYSIASLGDVVGMEDGDYGNQTLTDVSGKTGTANSAHVTFIPQHVNAVSVAHLGFGSGLTSGDGADHVTIDGIAEDQVGGTLTHDCNWDIGAASYDDTLDFVHTCSMYVQGAVNTNIQDSEIGPCLATAVGPSANDCSNSFTDSYNNPATSNVVWNNDTFHDVTCYYADCDHSENGGTDFHLQCMFILTHVTVENSRFYNCGIFDLFFQANGNTAANPFDGTVLQNNWFGPPLNGNFDSQCCRDTNVELSSTVNNVIIRYNSFGDGALVWGGSNGSSIQDGTTGNVDVGNIMETSNGSYYNCSSSITQRYNLYIGSGAQTCGGTGETTATSYPYVSDADNGSQDYHLSGTAGSTAADNLVPCGSAPYNLSFDIDGQSRPQNTNCDAGSDERGGSGGSTANEYVSTTGNDSTCVRGDSSKPCATFTKAYQLSQCGDVVEVAAGTYAQQTITDVATLDGCSSYVTLQPASGATVTLSCTPDSDGGCFALTLGSVNWTNNGGNGPSWLSIHNININGNTWIGGGNHNVQLVNVNAGGGNIRDVTNVLLQNDNFGPSDGPGVTPRTTNSDANWVFDGSGISTISITGSSFHDFLIGSTHFECVAINNVATLSVTGTSFNNCQIYGLDFGLYNQATSLLVDNDTFNNITNGWAVNLQSQRVDNLTVSNSTFGPGQYISQSSGTATNIRITNNNFQVAATCVGGATYSGNTWASGTCPGDSGGSGGGGTTTGSFNIGETRILGTVDQGNANLLLAQSATLSQAATIQSMSFYVTTADGSLRMGIYDSSGPGGGPGNLKAQTAEIIPTTGWNTANVISQVQLQPGTYWLAYLPSSNNLNFVNTSDSTSSSKLYNYSYGVLPSAFSTNPSSNSAHWSLYATLSTGSTSSVPGDADGDGHVGSSDLVALLATWHSTTNLSADFNNDGIVSIQDLSILLSHYGT